MPIKIVLDWELVDDRAGITHHEIIYSQKRLVIAEVIAEVYTISESLSVQNWWYLFPTRGPLTTIVGIDPLLKRKGKAGSIEECKKIIEQLLKVCDIKIAPKRTNIFA